MFVYIFIHQSFGHNTRYNGYQYHFKIGKLYDFILIISHDEIESPVVWDKVRKKFETGYLVPHELASFKWVNPDRGRGPIKIRSS